MQPCFNDLGTVEMRNNTPLHAPETSITKGVVFDPHELDIFQEAKTPPQNVFLGCFYPVFF